MDEPQQPGTPRSKKATTSRIGLKMAAAVGACTLAVLALLHVGGMQGSWAGLLAASLAAAACAYGATHRLLTQRIELARSTLRDVRRHRFESLGRLQVPKGDELNALIWQVYRTGQALEREIGELRKLENYRREYLGNVSHELKTPIFAVQGFAETLLDGALDDPGVRRAFVEKILRNTERLKHLTRDLSELSRIETGELKMEMRPFSLSRVAAEVAESLEPLAEARRVRLTLHIPTTLPPVVGDRERIRQVLTNLLDNAVKYNNGGGFARVEARVLPEGGVRVVVTDNGLGVAPPHVERLTERFFRADKSRSREQGGTGLGLAIVKHILAAHGTRLLIESRLGQGSSFGFILSTTPLPPSAEREALNQRLF